MKIVLDARMIGHSGIGSYLRGLLSGFSPEQRSRLTLLGNPGELKEFSCPVAEAREPIYGLAEQLKMPPRLKALAPDLFHAPHYNIPLLYGGRTVATVHDVIHLLFPAYSRTALAWPYARFLLGRVSRKCRRIMTDSYCTRRDLMRFGVPGEKIAVVPLAAGNSYRVLPPEEARAKLAPLGLSPGYILYVGNIRKIKNVPRLLAAYALLRERRREAPPLVLVGRDQIPAETAPYRGNSAIRFLGEVGAEDLPALYNGAALFAFPSLYEGFGVPVLEAQACGAPVVCSRAGSLAEVAGEGAFFTEPGSAEAISEALEKVLGNAALAEDLRRRGHENARRFSWQRTAQQVFKIYEEAFSL